jgi:hypothetical protein
MSQVKNIFHIEANNLINKKFKYQLCFIFDKNILFLASLSFQIFRE